MCDEVLRIEDSRACLHETGFEDFLESLILGTIFVWSRAVGIIPIKDPPCLINSGFIHCHIAAAIEAENPDVVLA